jgi:hypothetical protein
MRRRYIGASPNNGRQKMILLDLYRHARRRTTPRRIRRDDPTAEWTLREWADLPVHHPRPPAGNR